MVDLVSLLGFYVNYTVRVEVSGFVMVGFMCKGVNSTSGLI